MQGIMSLVNAVEFKGYKIKEWNIVQFSKLSPALSTIANEYKTRNIEFPELSDILSETSDTLSLTSSALTFLSPILVHAPEILRVSLGITPEKLEELSFSEGSILLLLILKANMEHVSSFFGALTTASPETA